MFGSPDIFLKTICLTKNVMPTVLQQLTTQEHGRLMPGLATVLFKECPLALEAVQELLSLGVRGAEVASLMINIHGSCAGTEWLVFVTTCWILLQ